MGAYIPLLGACLEKLIIRKETCTSVFIAACSLYALAERWAFLAHKVHCWCCCSVAQSCPTLCDPMDCSLQASLSFTISRSLLKLMSIKSVMPSNHLVLCCPLLLLPSIFLFLSLGDFYPLA